MAISSSAFGTLNKAISAYSDEMYTRAKKIVSTQLVGMDANINANGEDFIGQVLLLQLLTLLLRTRTTVELLTSALKYRLTSRLSVLTALTNTSYRALSLVKTAWLKLLVTSLRLVLKTKIRLCVAVLLV
jgi:hypothetical protein